MDDRKLLDRVVAGTVAGAAGAAALNTTTYLDMLVRGRAPSSVPKKDVQKIEEMAGIEPPDESQQETRSHRETAAGALLGYMVGLGVGAMTGLAWPLLRAVPEPLAAAAVGGGAMAGSDVPSIALGATDPRSWSPKAWAADIVPHLVYGVVTVAVTGALLSRDRRGEPSAA